MQPLPSNPSSFLHPTRTIPHLTHLPPHFVPSVASLFFPMLHPSLYLPHPHLPGVADLPSVAGEAGLVCPTMPLPLLVKTLPLLPFSQDLSRPALFQPHTNPFRNPMYPMYPMIVCRKKSSMKQYLNRCKWEGWKERMERSIHRCHLRMHRRSMFLICHGSCSGCWRCLMVCLICRRWATCMR